jgi:phosphatidate cytidylyltransferase
LAGLLVGTLFSSRVAFLVLVTVAVLTAQAEVYRALAARGMRAAQTLGIAAGGVILVGAYQTGARSLSFGLSLAVLATLFWFLAGPDHDGAVDGIAATLFGVLYPSFLAAHVVMMSRLPQGPVLTIAYLGAVALYDVGAYAFGSMFGRRPMSPSLSPKKTWEGTLGATLFVFVLAMAVGPSLGPFTLGSALALAAIVVVVSPFGDLAESMLKRDLDIKDMGSVLPGHGGVMDRIDSMLLVAPAAYWLIRLVVL